MSMNSCFRIQSTCKTATISLLGPECRPDPPAFLGHWGPKLRTDGGVPPPNEIPLSLAPQKTQCSLSVKATTGFNYHWAKARSWNLQEFFRLKPPPRYNACSMHVEQLLDEHLLLDFPYRREIEG